MIIVQAVIYCIDLSGYIDVNGVVLLLPILIVVAAKIIAHTGILLWTIAVAVFLRRTERDLTLRTAIFNTMYLVQYALIISALIKIAYGIEAIETMIFAGCVSILKVVTDFYCHDYAMI